MPEYVEMAKVKIKSLKRQPSLLEHKVDV